MLRRVALYFSVASAFGVGCGISAAGEVGGGDGATIDGGGPPSTKVDGGAHDAKAKGDAHHAMEAGVLAHDANDDALAPKDAGRDGHDSASAPDVWLHPEAAAEAGPHDARSDGVPSPDAGDAGRPVFSVVQNADVLGSGTTIVSVGIGATTAGNFLAVLVTYGNVGAQVMSVSDDANDAYLSANLRSLAGSCQASEIWYARNAQGGATSVTVTVNASAAHLEAWVLEVSGVSTSGGVDQGQAQSNGAATTTIAAPTVTPSGAPSLVVAALGSCGNVNGVVSGNPFTELGSENGNQSAYYIAKTVGAWGPEVHCSNDAWNASVAAFR